VAVSIVSIIAGLLPVAGQSRSNNSCDRRAGDAHRPPQVEVVARVASYGRQVKPIGSRGEPEVNRRGTGRELRSAATGVGETGGAPTLHVDQVVVEVGAIASAPFSIAAATPHALRIEHPG